MPGPSTYWLDSIVELTPAAVTDLKTRYSPVAAAAQPDVWKTLTDALPAGGYLTSGALDEAFSSARIRSKAFLAEQAPVIVITAMGE